MRIYLSPAEKREWKRRAKLAKISLSELVRRAMSAGKAMAA